jgi:hypothetical protein
MGPDQTREIATNRSSAAVATNREGHRFPRSGKAERRRGKPLDDADVLV